MYFCRIVGHATSTVKHPSLEGARLLLAMALQADGHTPEGDPILVIDRLGAGHGETVMVTSDGISAGEMLQSKNTPVRWSVLGIPDGGQGTESGEQEAGRKGL